MLTAKLVCLLAAILIFAPRVLYGATGHLMHVGEQWSAAQELSDQHIAGLLMIAACPLSYLVAAVVITAQLINLRDASHATSWRARQVAG
jgi:putative membrane protein